MTETMPYEVTGKAGDIEFRKYPALVLATVDSGGMIQGSICCLPISRVKMPRKILFR